MNSRSKYKTKQRERIVEYLSTVPGIHVTASDVAWYFREQGTEIGQSTIYRQLESLVDDGIINKYTIDKNSPACFEFVGSESHEGHTDCFHCKCEKCGRLIHLHGEQLDSFRAFLSEKQGFQLDPKRTVFYGLCEKCR